MKSDEPVDILGEGATILVGKSWLATEYPVPAYYSEELTEDRMFCAERSIFFNFSCFADKIGGQVFHIQGHGEDVAPVDSEKKPMVYLGQFLGSPDVEIGDCGIAYLYYSPVTGETIMAPEWF